MLCLPALYQTVLQLLVAWSPNGDPRYAEVSFVSIRHEIFAVRLNSMHICIMCLQPNIFSLWINTIAFTLNELQIILSISVAHIQVRFQHQGFGSFGSYWQDNSRACSWTESGSAYVIRRCLCVCLSSAVTRVCWDKTSENSIVRFIKHVLWKKFLKNITSIAQQWQRDLAKLDTFSMNVQRYSQNHA